MPIAYNQEVDIRIKGLFIPKSIKPIHSCYKEYDPSCAECEQYATKPSYLYTPNKEIPWWWDMNHNINCVGCDIYRDDHEDQERYR